MSILKCFSSKKHEDTDRHLGKDENPNLTVEGLKIIRSRLEHGIEKSIDLEILDFFLSSTIRDQSSSSYILNKFKKYDIYSYSDYIDEKKELIRRKITPVKHGSKSEQRAFILNSTLLGVLYGSISFLEDELDRL
jgi:hypothetical protein